MHPNRTKVITHEQAQEAVQKFVNSHFGNDGPKVRFTVPAHEDDPDILLSDYIEQQKHLSRK